ncbi:MAG: carboxypeptidase regulatory-like domain-containing protein [Candidatus Diapherotrites archaeon]|uniref:Carboxypeptidase regulatory-like domain-containing protein n=1 Tax=Candidatus Iainarchaeum sp. TaxID=3101447 RepID=A0A8T3YNE4_9ARCH|nr:carboxypeptidase regulatory-like domain-containing protein [Candidatus Diapherotrites archaeon]
MYDRYDSPHPEEEDDSGAYEESAMDRASEIGSSATDFLKENWKKLLALLILAGAAYAAYDYFVGSVKAVSFEVMDTEGGAISGTVRISAPSGQEINTVNSGEELKLKAGEYDIDVQAKGYKTVTGKSIKVADDGSVSITLEADKDLEIGGEFPQSFATGEEKAMQIIVTNKGRATEAELLLEGDAKESLELGYPKPLDLAPGENMVQATLKAKDSPPEKSIGKDRTGTIRIAGLGGSRAKITGKFTLVKFDRKKISVTFNGSESRAEMNTIKAGASPDDNRKTIRVRNDNEIEVNDIQASINITSTEFSRKEDVVKWFEFVPSNIFNAQARSEASITVLPHIPAGIAFPAGKETETIAGIVEVKSALFSRTFQLSMELAKLKSGIEVSGLADTLTAAKDKDAYRVQTGILQIRNRGEVLLTQVTPRAACDSKGTVWLKLVDTGYGTDGFTMEKNSDAQQIPYTISVPPETPAQTITHCSLGVLYKANGIQQAPYTKTITIITS